MTRLLDAQLLADEKFWSKTQAQLPRYDRAALPTRSICFSAGKMAYGHTADILQDLLNDEPSTGVMTGIETFAQRYCNDLAASDYLMTQLIFEDVKDQVVPRIQGAITSVLFVDADTQSLTWKKMMQLAADPAVQFATINAPEGAYGVVYSGGDLAEPASDAVISDMSAGTVISDLAKWTAFARERFIHDRPFSLVSCTNFNANGHFTGGAVRLMGKAWEDAGHAPAGFLDYLSDPRRFAFPNCMIDRIAVPPDEKTTAVLEKLGIASQVVVTERTRYWVVEDLFPAGRPAFEKAAGVIMESSYHEVKKYEDMKLRILNMAHSTMAGLGVLLGYRGPYSMYRAMQDSDLTRIIDRVIAIVIDTIEHPSKMRPEDFARDTIVRLNNPNIPDDPMRIAFNASTKILPRFMDTYFAGRTKGMSEDDLVTVLLPVAGVLRYCLGVDDKGERYELEGDPIRDRLVALGGKARVGEPSSVSALRELIADKDIMGRDLYQYGSTGKRLEELTAGMLAGEGAVRKAVREAR